MASSIVGTTSIVFNPDDLMEFYSVIVTCKIDPTSIAEYCQVFARNDDAGVPPRSSKYM